MEALSSGIGSIPVNNEKLEIMIVAGEASGDELGAKFVEEVRRIEPKTSFFGTCGPRMRRAAVESILDTEGWSITGVVPVVRSIPTFLRRLQKLKRTANERKPAAVVLIDFPEFNLKLAKALKKDGHTVIYYVSPQLWAWRKYRVAFVRKYVDLLLSILPFEKGWYAKKGVDHVEYVGNPIAENVRSNTPKADFCSKHGLDPDKPIIAMLPGSRRKEIHYHVPVMAEAAKLIALVRPEIQFVFAVSRSQHIETINSTLSRPDVRLVKKMIVVQGETFDALNAADAAAIASGTATLEAGIIGAPMAIVYKMSKLDAAVLGRFIDVEHVGLINLVAGKRVANEFVQEQLTAESLSNELFRLLDPDVNARVRRELKLATETLGKDASRKAAEAVIRMLRRAD